MKKIFIDKLGRIVIPVSIRKALDLKVDTELDISIFNGSVLIRRAVCYCKLCYSKTDTRNEFGICKNCIEKIKESEK